MKALALKLYEPIKVINDQPWHFAVWWITANVLGLAGLWLPLLFLHYCGRPTYLTFQNIVRAGGLASFCVVILAEGIACNLIARKTGSSPTAIGIRALFCIIAVILALIPAGIMVVEHVATDDLHVSISFQIVVTLLAILLASYLYCFRFPILGEKEVGYIRDAEDTEVRHLAEEAQFQKTDDKGVKL